MNQLATLTFTKRSNRYYIDMIYMRLKYFYTSSLLHTVILLSLYMMRDERCKNTSTHTLLT